MTRCVERVDSGATRRRSRSPSLIPVFAKLKSIPRAPGTPDVIGVAFQFGKTQVGRTKPRSVKTFGDGSSGGQRGFESPSVMVRQKSSSDI